jgi:hypothetical protein
MSKIKMGGRLIVLRGRILVGPFGDREAESILRSITNRYRKLGLQPPKFITTTILHPRPFLESWVTEDIQRTIQKDQEQEEEGI